MKDTKSKENYNQHRVSPLVLDLQTPLGKAGRVYKMYEKRLARLSIFKLEDFLFHIPFRYEDYTLISKIENVQPGETVTIKGKVIEIKNEYTKNFKKIQKAKIADNTEVIDVIWFNQPFILNSIHVNDLISLSGNVEKKLNKIIMQSPQYELGHENTIHTGRLVPVYPETYGVSSKWLRRQAKKLLDENKTFDDYLPDFILEKYQYPNLKESLQNTHFPQSLESAKKARERLSFDELFLMQLSSMLRKQKWQEEIFRNPYKIDGFKNEINEFWQKLPFELTAAQKKAISEILKDFSSNKPMNRLLEGDVGSGKTVVAAFCAYISFLNGDQSVLMAPTEILAQQHYKTLNDLLSDFGIKVGLQTGSIKNKEQNTDILVGTHAILSKNVNFKNLGLVVIDEQQRFGVEQRSIIRGKGNTPHLLTMTATPIPRTVALTMYGDLDLSYLYEMPKGRKKVKTWLVPDTKRDGAYKWIGKQIKQNKSQAFIICPFIEESESMQSVKAAVKEYEHLKKVIFPNLKLNLLHGKLKTKEKEQILEKFRKAKTDILVTTPVVEVGIDIPNATIMMIEGAERFGLAQLHQLRGRVGRSKKQSFCLLFTDAKNEKSVKRLKAMEKIDFGAELAELDLKLRGPGQIFGTLQHGIPALKVASFSDFDLIEKTRKEAELIFPQILKYPKLFGKIKKNTVEQVSPD